MYGWSFDEGQEEHSSGERLMHDFSIIVQHLIDLPLKYENLSVLSIAREDCGFFAAELAMVNRMSSSAVVGIVGIFSVAPSISATSTSPSSSIDCSSRGSEASKGISMGRLSSWRARSLDGVIIASFPCCGYATGLCLSGHDGREGWVGLSFVGGKNGDCSCQRLQLCFILFVFFCRYLHIDVFRTSLLAFASRFAEAIAGSFFVVGLGVVLVE
jgi:hypothetical protein